MAGAGFMEDHLEWTVNPRPLFKLDNLSQYQSHVRMMFGEHGASGQMRLLVLPRYARNGPSSRLRHYQFISYLNAAGFVVDIEPLLPDDYLQLLYSGKRWPYWKKIVALLKRLQILAKTSRYDLVWVEKEVLPFFPAWPERFMAWRRVRFVADYDDAWHLRYRESPLPIVRHLFWRKIEFVMRNATLVTAGNSYLEDIAREGGASWIVQIPTVLDPSHYRVASHRERRPVQIVWIGSSLNTRYLVPIAEALAHVCKSGHAELIVVGGRPVELSGVPARFEPWSEQGESELLAAADIGIMPLDNTEWARGKCAYKILQYMAAGLPVVASPIGVNATIVSNDVGFLATSADEWTHSLSRLINDVELRDQMGRAGRSKVEREFSLSTWGPQLANLLVEATTKPLPKL